MTPPLGFLGGLAPCKLNASVIAIDNLRINPNVGVEPWRSGGDLFASFNRVSACRPAASFRTPYNPALQTLIGFGMLTLTTFEAHLATFDQTAGTRGTASQRWSMAANAKAFACIQRVTTEQGAVSMAEVMVYFASADGMTAPIGMDTSTVPSLTSGSAVLVSTGPISANGTTEWGVSGWSLDCDPMVDVPLITDGFIYPVIYQYRGANPTVTVNHYDPSALYAALGLTGLESNGSTNFLLYARSYDSANAVLVATGMCLTMAKARATLESIAVSQNEMPKVVIKIHPAAATGSATHSVAVTTGVTLPVAS